MGVKGLQGFLDSCCPDACVTVNLRDMARQHAAQSQQGAVLVVDGMACLRHWYSCRDWVCGGQWREYMEILRSWVEAFTSAGIRLVFFFDGVIEEQKRQEWVKRRRRVNREVSKIFRHIRAHGEQPGRELLCLPSGLSTFTCFALRSLGQEAYFSLRDADYEIASYARQHSSMGILGQDSDFIIYDSAPYLSVAKLQINSLTTVLYDRQKLCRTIGSAVGQLPLLACLLGNDVVSQEKMQHIRNNAMATYSKNNSDPRGQMVLAVAQLVSSLWTREEEDTGRILQSLNLTHAHKELLKRGICSYLLPGQEACQQGDTSALPSAFEKYVSPQILKACREKHIAGEGFMVYGVVYRGIIDCSNTLEDEEDAELLPQALVYKPCRQHIYGLLLLGHEGSSEDLPAVKEWFVYPGNPLKEPDVVHPSPISLPCDCPSLDLLWFGTGPDISAFRLTTFLSILDCQDFSELFVAVEDFLLGALCLVTYIVLQVPTLSQEDVDAYLSQAVCLRLKSPLELQLIKLPSLSSRAVQLGSLYVRGLSHLLSANCASGCPLPSAALMPWRSFDGRLFHSKYLLAHSGTEESVLLDCDSSCLSLFLYLRERLIETCRRRGRVLQSSPRPVAPERHHDITSGPGHRGWSSGSSEGRRWRGEMTQVSERGGGWRQRSEARVGRGECGNRQRLEERGGPHRNPSWPDGGRLIQSRGRPNHGRGRYRLAPRWQQPPAPGT